MAGMAKSADAPRSNRGEHTARVGSSPSPGTTRRGNPDLLLRKFDPNYLKASAHDLRAVPDDITAEPTFEQLFGSAKEPRWQGEKALMLAAIEDGVQCFKKYAHGQNERAKEIFAETKAWIETEDSSWPFSFKNICENLDISAETIRKALAKWLEEHPEPVKSPWARKKHIYRKCHSKTRGVIRGRQYA